MGRNGYIEKIRLIEFPDRLDVGRRVWGWRRCVSRMTPRLWGSNWKLD